MSIRDAFVFTRVLNMVTVHPRPSTEVVWHLGSQSVHTLFRLNSHLKFHKLYNCNHDSQKGIWLLYSPVMQVKKYIYLLHKVLDSCLIKCIHVITWKKCTFKGAIYNIQLIRQFLLCTELAGIYSRKWRHSAPPPPPLSPLVCCSPAPCLLAAPVVCSW